MRAHEPPPSWITRHYERDAPVTDQTSAPIVRGRVARWVEAWPLRGPVLDVGCGVGENLEVIAPRHRVVGTDISLDGMRNGRTDAPRVVADAAHLPFRDGAFGGAVCTEVLEHVADPAVVLDEIARVLRPDGHAYVTTPNYANLAGLHKWIADRRSGRHDWNPWGAHEGGYEAFMTGRRLRRAAARSLEVVQARGIDYGQAITGRFELTDRVAWSAPGKALLRRLLPRLEHTSNRLLVWHAMHIELVLRPKR